MSLELETALTHSIVPAENGWEAMDFYPTNTCGIAIVGEAQAGKSTLQRIVDDVGQLYFPDGEILQFTNSNGFRGLTVMALKSADVALDAPVEGDVYLDFLEAFASQFTDDELACVLDELYRNPLPESQLRSEAIKTTVALTAEHADIRPLVNAAGGRRLRQLVDEPDLGGMKVPPWLVILDARSQTECQHKFEQAGIQSVGTFVLTCPATDAAARKLKGKGGDDLLKLEAAKIDDRNRIDRDRTLGRMTLPQDLSIAYKARDLLDGGSLAAIVDAGKSMASWEGAGVEFATNKLTEDDERLIVDLLTAGILSTVGN